MTGVTSSTGTYYSVVIPPTGADGLCPRYILFRPRPKAVIPADVAALQIDIDRSLTVLTSLFPRTGSRNSRISVNEAKFTEYYEKIAGIAIAGIGQDQTLLGVMALESLKAEVVAREGGRIKNAYVAKLGLWAIGFSGLFAIGYLLARFGSFGSISNSGILGSWVGVKKNFFALFAGSAIGTWLSFSIRKTEIKFSELAVIENDQLNPALRLAFVAGLTLVVGLFFLTGFASIKIGAFTTDMTVSGSYALLIGLFCGIGEQGLSTTVGTKTTDFFSLLARSGATVNPSPPDGGAALGGPARPIEAAGDAKNGAGADKAPADGAQQAAVEAGAPHAAPDIELPDDYAQTAAGIRRATLQGDAGP